MNSAESESALDATLESVLPGAHVQFSNKENNIDRIYKQEEAAIAANDEQNLLFVVAARWFSNRLGDGSPPVAQVAAVLGEERMEGERLEVPQEDLTSDNEGGVT